MPSTRITETGFQIVDANGFVIVDQPYDPRREGFEPIPEEDRQALANIELARVMGSIPMPKPQLHIEQSPIGPDASKARINGMDMRVQFVPGADNLSVNGIHAKVTVTVAGHLLNGEDGFPSMDDVFSMTFQPVDAVDEPSGPAISKAITFKKGLAEIDFFPPSPCTYLVTEQSINHRLPPEKQLVLVSPIRVQAEIP